MADTSSNIVQTADQAGKLKSSEYTEWVDSKTGIVVQASDTTSDAKSIGKIITDSTYLKLITENPETKILDAIDVEWAPYKIVKHNTEYPLRTTKDLIDAINTIGDYEFDNDEKKNYIAYEDNNGELASCLPISKNDVKFVSDINLSNEGVLTYNTGKLTYATGADGGTEDKGLVSIDTSRLLSAYMTTEKAKFGLSVDDGIVKVITTAPAVITISGQQRVVPGSTVEIVITWTSNYYTCTTPSVVLDGLYANESLSSTKITVTGIGEATMTLNASTGLASGTTGEIHINNVTFDKNSVGIKYILPATITLADGVSTAVGNTRTGDDQNEVKGSFKIICGIPIYLAGTKETLYVENSTYVTVIMYGDTTTTQITKPTIGGEAYEELPDNIDTRTGQFIYVPYSNTVSTDTVIVFKCNGTRYFTATYVNTITNTINGETYQYYVFWISAAGTCTDVGIASLSD